MSMTREEAIKYAESKKMRLEALVYSDDCKYGNYAMYSGELSFVNAALSALRPVSRERVEKVFPGCEKCRNQANWPSWIEKGFVYCPKCGTPLTSWAWEKQVERLEALHGETKTD